MARKRSDQWRIMWWLTLATGTAVFVVLASFTEALSPIHRVLVSTGAVFHSGGLTVRQWFGFSDASCAGGESDSRVAVLEAEIARLKSEVSELPSLRSALDYRASVKTDLVAARVIYESGESYTRRIVIDQGSSAGIAVGQPVLVGAGLLVGKVSEVGAFTSVVTPTTDSSSRLAATVQGQTATLGVLQGDRGAALNLNLVPKAERIAVGDTVVTSGLEAGIRRGLAVGTVTKVVVSTQDPFQSAVITPFPEAIHPAMVQVIRGETSPLAN